MATTIQISEKPQQELVKRKLYSNETYEETIWDLIEDTMTLSEETKREIAEARKEIVQGKFFTLDDLKRKYGLSRG